MRLYIRRGVVFLVSAMLFILLLLQFEQRTESAKILPIPLKNEYRIAVLTSADVPEQNRMAEGIQAALIGQGTEQDARIAIQSFKAEDFQTVDEAAKRAIRTSPDLILTVGTDMTKSVARATRRIPVVGVGVLRFRHDSFFYHRDNITGIGDMPAIFRELKLTARILPLRTLGVLFDPDNERSMRQVELLRVVAKGRSIHLYEVACGQNALDDAEKFIGHVDAVYMPEEESTWDKTEKISSFLLQYGIPLLSENEEAVAHGALISLSADYYRMGFMGGIMASRLLTGQITPKDLPITEQQELDCTLNMAVVNRLHLQIPSDIWQRAKKLYLYEGRQARPLSVKE